MSIACINNISIISLFHCVYDSCTESNDSLSSNESQVYHSASPHKSTVALGQGWFLGRSSQSGEVPPRLLWPLISFDFSTHFYSKLYFSCQAALSSPHEMVNRLLLALVVSFASPIFAGFITADDLAAQYSLTVSTSVPFPTATLAPSDTSAFLVNNWSLNKNKIQSNASNLAFVSDPFPTSFASPVIEGNSSGPVLRITYGKGSFGDTDGGAQFLSLFNGSIQPQTMMLTYDLAFDDGFQFVKGGKLPGLRGGSNVNGCEGGSQPNGTDCWSTRLMWRTSGAGEVYAYIPTPNDLCDQNNIICNSDFGTSIGRGSYTWSSGAWNRVTILVQLNSPGNVANGNVLLYYNEVLVISQSNLQMRSETSVLASGLFFSTFFGGSDSSWQSPIEQHTYYRNFRLWAGTSPSNLTGQTVSSAGPSITQGGLRGLVLGFMLSAVGLWLL